MDGPFWMSCGRSPWGDANYKPETPFQIGLLFLPQKFKNKHKKITTRKNRLKMRNYLESNTVVPRRENSQHSPFPGGDFRTRRFQPKLPFHTRRSKCQMRTDFIYNQCVCCLSFATRSLLSLDGHATSGSSSSPTWLASPTGYPGRLLFGIFAPKSSIKRETTLYIISF